MLSINSLETVDVELCSSTDLKHEIWWSREFFLGLVCTRFVWSFLKMKITHFSSFKAMLSSSATLPSPTCPANLHGHWHETMLNLPQVAITMPQFSVLMFSGPRRRLLALNSTFVELTSIPLLVTNGQDVHSH